MRPLARLIAITLALLTCMANGLSVSNTILVFARDSGSAYSATSGLAGHGIPYQTVIVPQAGVTLPTLNSSLTSGNYGGIIVLSEVSYSYNGSWASAISATQWQQLYSYQTTFGVRMVRLDVYPGPDFGITYNVLFGCPELTILRYYHRHRRRRMLQHWY